MIPRETIDSIFNRARIEEVVSDFVNLKKRGVNYIGLCPFHNEKTPSFTVSAAKGIYKCFGCGRGGNVVNFVMEHEQIDYPNALRYIAKKYNIEIVEREKTAKEAELESERESLMIVCSFAQKFYSDNLQTEQGKAIGLSYFEERGFTNETIEKFQLGYAPESYKAFLNAALHAGYKLKYLVQAGLVVNRQPAPVNSDSTPQNINNNEPPANDEPTAESCFDRFAGRVIFPIHNISGRVIAFGGRTLRKDKNVAKYINSPETILYHKSNVLYGIHLARRAITSEDNCFLTEGYADVITLHQSGVENAVASSGTSLTVEQVRLIRRYTPNLTILYDGDEAGLKAGERGLLIALKEGMNVKIVTLPPEHDPDTFARQYLSEGIPLGQEQNIMPLQQYLASIAMDFIVFRTRTLAKSAEDDPLKKAGLIKEIVLAIAHIPDLISRSVYLKECSRLMQVEEAVLWNEMRLARRKLFDNSGQSSVVSGQPGLTPYPLPLTPVFSCDPQEKEVIRVLIKYGDEEGMFTGEHEPDEEPPLFKMKIAEYIINSLKEDNVGFENLVCQRLYDECCQRFANGESLSEDYFLKHNDEDIGSFVVSISDDIHILSDWSRRSIGIKSEKDHLGLTAEKAVYALKSRKVELMLKDLQEHIRQPLNDDELSDMMNYKRRLDTAKIVLKKKLGRVI